MQQLTSEQSATAREVLQNYIDQLQHELARGKFCNVVRAERLCDRIYSFRKNYQYSNLLSLNQQTAIWRIAAARESLVDIDIQDLIS